MKRRTATDRTAVGYIRVSTEEQARDGVSLAAQEERVRAFAVATARPLSEVIVDDGASAKDVNREGVQRILVGIRAGTIGAIIVLKLDRLTRSLGDLQDLLKLFERRDVALISVSESLDTKTPSGRLMLNILGSVSQWEREEIGKRTSFALAHLRRTGKAYGPTPFGFVRHGDELVADAAQQSWLSKVRALSADGVTLQQIADQLNAAGVACPRSGRKWYPSSVKAILNSKAAADAA